MKTEEKEKLVYLTAVNKVANKLGDEPNPETILVGDDDLATARTQVENALTGKSIDRSWAIPIESALVDIIKSNLTLFGDQDIHKMFEEVSDDAYDQIVIANTKSATLGIEEGLPEYGETAATAPGIPEPAPEVEPDGSTVTHIKLMGDLNRIANMASEFGIKYREMHNTWSRANFGHMVAELLVPKGVVLPGFLQQLVVTIDPSSEPQ